MSRSILAQMNRSMNPQPLHEFMDMLLQGKIACLCPDNARIPLRIGPEYGSVPCEFSGLHSSCGCLASRQRKEQSRWSNASPAAQAIEAACLVAGLGTAHVASVDILPDDLLIWNEQVLERSRSRPKDLLESSMGTQSLSKFSLSAGNSLQASHMSSPIFSRRSSSSSPCDRWANKGASVPPSPPCRHLSFVNVADKDTLPAIRSNSNRRTHTNKTVKPKRRNSCPNYHSLMETPRNVVRKYSSNSVHRNVSVTGAIVNTTIHTKKNVLSSQFYEYEQQRISSLFKRLPDSLRAPPY